MYVKAKDDCSKTQRKSVAMPPSPATSENQGIDVKIGQKTEKSVDDHCKTIFVIYHF